jgi:hypothetical protein
MPKNDPPWRQSQVPGNGVHGVRQETRLSSCSHFALPVCSCEHTAHKPAIRMTRSHDGRYREQPRKGHAVLVRLTALRGSFTNQLRRLNSAKRRRSRWHAWGWPNGAGPRSKAPPFVLNRTVLACGHSRGCRGLRCRRRVTRASGNQRPLVRARFCESADMSSMRSGR